MEKHSKLKYYDGSSAIEAFLMKVNLNAALKGYRGKKRTISSKPVIGWSCSKRIPETFRR